MLAIITVPLLLASNNCDNVWLRQLNTEAQQTTPESVHANSQPIYDENSHLDPAYLRKARLLNNAIQQIGMGRYQWGLFFVTGFGWLADNLWPIVTGLILPPIVNELSSFQGPFIKLAQNIGLLVGAIFWAVGSDIWGRRVSFDITLLIVGVFATAAGASPNTVALCSFAAIWSVGVGGNLPVDSAIFLEFVPATHQYLLAVLSIWWAFGQLLGSLIAWSLIANFSYPTRPTNSTEPYFCTTQDSMGWRYFLYTMGGLMLALWGVRFFLFQLRESPKFLMSKGQDAKAVEVIQWLALKNGKQSNLTVERLRSINSEQDAPEAPEAGGTNRKYLSMQNVLKNHISKFEAGRIKDLFAPRQVALSTGMLITIWDLPIFQTACNLLTVREIQLLCHLFEVILSVIGVPGALLAGLLIEIPVLGQRGTLALSTALTGIFILASTTAKSSTSLLGWNCAYSFTSNVMYGVLYCMSSELFPTAIRGTGNAIVAAANRIFGIMAPMIALYADLTTSAPIFVSGAIFVFAGLIALLLPFESRGTASV